MSAGPNSPSPTRLSPQTAWVLSLAIALFLALADALTPSDVALPLAYGIPVVLTGWSRSLRLVWGLTLGLVLLTFVLFFWGPPPLHPHAQDVAFFNRLLAAVALVAIASLAHLRVLFEDTLEQQRLALEKQNVELDLVNQELSQREEEVVRQNEELQSQTEELERQSEELRVANDDLAERERTLELLLDLSRSLTAELERDEMLKRICEAMGLLAAGNASAVLEKRGDQLVLVCHHGFGPEGPDATAIPAAHSFTALIMSRGQTGYLEDIDLRRELRIPQPRSGAPLRSVISSPLHIHGRSVGAIEVYAHQPQSWNEAQISMVESLAAQASISLQSALLVEAIRNERERFEAAFRTMPFGMAVAEDAAGSRVRFNPSAAALFGVPLDENVSPFVPLGRRLRRHLFHGDRPLQEEEFPLVRALRGEEVQNDEIDVVLPTGKHYALLVSAAPIYDSTGKIAGAVCGFADIMPQKSLQRELENRRREAEEANLRKTRFLAAVSHDIRTPANAITLMAEVIGRMASNPAMVSQITEMAQKLRGNALALVGLISEVLDLARFDSGKVDLQESEFSLGALIEQECRQLQPLAQQKGLELMADPLAQQIWMHTDRVKLARVLGNLIGNAIKFTEAGRVEVRADLTPERCVRIRVSDTGIGIAAENLSRIFDEFAQLRNPERDSSKGTGLGLAICRRLIEVMGGDIAVESTPNQGSTFTVTFPPCQLVLRLDAPLLAQAVPPRTAVALPAPATLSGLRVLVVEDHPTTREGTLKLLLGEGATVTEAADARTALQLLGRDSFDVILLDMMLPDFDGREVLKSLCGQRPPGLRAVVVMTGDLTQERRQEIQQLGANALIEKPIDVDKLVATLRSVQETRSQVG